MLPKLTHLQFAVLSVLCEGEMSGQELRERLGEVFKPKVAAAFYQLMGRLEDERLVTGKYRTETIGGRPVRERVYEITGGGRAAIEEVREFVLRPAFGLPRLAPSA